jgi:hypothetical protein
MKHAFSTTIIKKSSEGRRVMRLLWAIFLGALLIGSVHAETKTIGAWIVNTELDRFSDKTNVVAFTINGQGGLGIRCLSGNLTIALTEANTKYQVGDTFGIDLRVDRQPIVTTTGTAISEAIIEVSQPSPEVIKELGDGRELAARISGAVAWNTVVFGLANVSKAIAPVLKACPLNGDQGM